MDRWPAAAHPASVGRAPSLLPAALARGWGGGAAGAGGGRRPRSATFYGFSYTKVFLWAAAAATLLVASAVLLGTQAKNLKASSENANLLSIDGGSLSGSFPGNVSPSPIVSPTPTLRGAGSGAGSGSLSGDPHFVGFDGTGFDFHGWHKGIFNILSEKNHQVNAQLDSFGMEKATFVKEVAFKYRPANVKVRVAAVRAGKLAVEVDERGVVPIYGHVYMNLSDTASLKYQARADDMEMEQVTLQTDDFVLRVYIEPKELHLNLQVSFVDAKKPLITHGVMGQTYGWILNEDAVDTKQFDAGEQDASYQVSSLFADDFKFNLFGLESED